MPTERDLRTTFDRVASGIEPDVQRHLHQAVRHGRRRVLVRRTVGVVSILTVAALIVIAGPATLRWVRDLRPDEPAGTPTPSPTSVAVGTPIAGTYSIVLADAPGAIRREAMAGRWKLRLEPDGTVLLTSPSSFAASTTGIVFTLNGDQFRTNAFATDLCGDAPSGLYRWQRSGIVLRFTVVADSCAPRVALFATEPWQKSG